MPLGVTEWAVINFGYFFTFIFFRKFFGNPLFLEKKFYGEDKAMVTNRAVTMARGKINWWKKL